MTTGLIKRALLGACFAASLIGASQASPLIVQVNQSFDNGFVSIGYNNSGSFTFSDVSTGPFDFNPVAVATAGGSQVTAIDNPFFGPPAPTVFQDSLHQSGFQPSIFGPLSQTGPVLYTYLSFASPATIPYSITRYVIGLMDVSGGETHYGFAELYGTELLSYGFETANNTAIVTPVPLPSSAPMLGAALLALGGAGYGLKRKKAATTA